MPITHRVIWSEGMFLRPQHFQQHDRYLESYADGRCRGLRAFDWGFDLLVLDSNLLALGKLAITQCRGIFPDGTPFAWPEQDSKFPLVLDVPEEVRNSVVYLCLPLRLEGMAEFTGPADANSLARYYEDECKLLDNNTGSEADVRIGKARARLMLEGQDRSGYACLGVVRIIEVKAGGAKLVRLDPSFIAPALNCFGTGILAGFLREILGVLDTRGNALAEVVTGIEKMVAAEASHLLALQTINRHQPALAHWASTARLHPEDFYRFLAQLAGELSTFYRLPGRRPISYPSYQHDDLQSCFIPLMDELRQLLLVEVERRAFQIPLDTVQKNAAYKAARPDPSLLETATFILAAKAAVPPEMIVTGFPNTVKIAPLEDIRYLVSQALPGITVRALPHVPPHIPRRSGLCYFELDKNSPLWKKLATSSGFAIHIGSNFPDLELEFWATTRD